MISVYLKIDLHKLGRMRMLEDPATPVFLDLTSIEWHAFGYGLKEGFKCWKRRPLAWDEANALARLQDI